MSWAVDDVRAEGAMSDALFRPTRTTNHPQTRNAPPAVEDAWRLVSAGVDRDTAAGELALRHGEDRDRLEEAVLFWYRRMHRFPSDDFQATRVLRVLEEALRRVPRTPMPTT